MRGRPGTSLADRFTRLGSLFEPDTLVPQQYADMHGARGSSPEMELCQALVEGALYQLAKGSARLHYWSTLDWIRDVDGSALRARTRGFQAYPITFEKAVTLGYPRLRLSPQELSTAVLRQCDGWTRATAPVRPWHFVSGGRPRAESSLRRIGPCPV